MFDEFDDLDEFCFDFLCRQETQSSGNQAANSSGDLINKTNTVQPVVKKSASNKITKISKSGSCSSTPIIPQPVVPVSNIITSHVASYPNFNTFFMNNNSNTTNLNSCDSASSAKNTTSSITSATLTPFSMSSIPHPIPSASIINSVSFLGDAQISMYNLCINPWRFRFLPQGQWENRQVCLATLLKTHFQSRSTKKIRFEHKLWNALQLTSSFPELYQIFGLSIVTPVLLKADRDKMGNSFALTKPNAALFNQQGAFPSHGFIEVTQEDAVNKYHAPQYLITDVDEMKVRLYAPKDHDVTLVEHLQNCHWNSPNNSM